MVSMQNLDLALLALAIFEDQDWHRVVRVQLEELLEEIMSKGFLMGT